MISVYDYMIITVMFGVCGCTLHVWTNPTLVNRCFKMYNKNQQYVCSGNPPNKHLRFWRTVKKGLMQLGIKNNLRALGTHQNVISNHRGHNGTTYHNAGESPARFRSGPKALSEPGRDGRDVQRQHL